MTPLLWRRSVVTALLMCGVVVPAAAQDPAPPEAAPAPRVGVSVRASTLGYGAEVALALSRRANVRLGGNLFRFTDEFDEIGDNITYRTTVRLRSGHAFFDWFPFEGGFHVSPGLVFANGNEAQMRASIPSGERFGIDNEQYTSGPGTPVVATGSVTFRSVSPAVVIGWGNLVPRSRRWAIPIELGVVMSGAPSAKLGFSGTVCDATGANCRDIAGDSTVQAHIREEQERFNDDLRPFRFYPVLSVGVAFRF